MLAWPKISRLHLGRRGPRCVQLWPKAHWALSTMTAVTTGNAHDLHIHDGHLVIDGRFTVGWKIAAHPVVAGHRSHTQPSLAVR